MDVQIIGRRVTEHFAGKQSEHVVNIATMWARPTHIKTFRLQSSPASPIAQEPKAADSPSHPANPACISALLPPERNFLVSNVHASLSELCQRQHGAVPCKAYLWLAALAGARSLQG